VQRPSQAQTEIVRDTVHQKQSDRDWSSKASGGGNFETFLNFQKIKKVANCPKRAQNQKHLKNFTLIIFQNFQIFLFLCAFQTISSIFYLFENFENSE
jgi:hypothetical protein